MARCLTCGIRYLGVTPGCGHPQPPLERDLSTEDDAPPLDWRTLEVPGYRLTGLLGTGGFAKCYAFTNVATTKLYAATIVPK